MSEQLLLEQQQEQEQLMQLQLMLGQMFGHDWTKMFVPHPTPPPIPMDLDTSRRFVGVVKSFNTSTGFGFISCDDTYAVFGRDVFLFANQRNGSDVGDQVSFTIEMSSRGFPRAKDIELMNTRGD